MNRRLFVAASAAALLFTGAMASAQGNPKPPGYVSMEGVYVWNEKDSKYASPAYAREQIMTISRDDPGGFKLGQNIVLIDGKKTDWVAEGTFGGPPVPAGFITLQLKRVGNDAFSNDYTMADGKKGAEVFQIKGDRITIKGSFRDTDGKDYPYTEIWDRRKK
jgi:hypothetical protein